MRAKDIVSLIKACPDLEVLDLSHSKFGGIGGGHVIADIVITPHKGMPCSVAATSVAMLSRSTCVSIVSLLNCRAVFKLGSSNAVTKLLCPVLATLNGLKYLSLDCE